VFLVSSTVHLAGWLLKAAAAAVIRIIVTVAIGGVAWFVLQWWFARGH